jgi:hypothetical protein
MDYSKITDVIVDGVDMKDYPDFSDAFIVSACYDGEPMSEDEIEDLNEDADFVHEKAIESLQYF